MLARGVVAARWVGSSWIVPIGLHTARCAVAHRLDGTFDYTQAKLFHFLHDIDTTETSGIVESTKMPLESRIWRFYQG